MPKFIPFTDAQKEQAASVDLEEFLRRRGEKLIASGRDKRLASDHSITILRQKKKRQSLRSPLSCRRRTSPCVGYMPICCKSDASTVRYSMTSCARSSSTKAVRNPRMGQRNITTPCSSGSMNTAFPVMDTSADCTPPAKATAAILKGATRSTVSIISAEITRSMYSKPLSTYSPISPFTRKTGRSITMWLAAGHPPFRCWRWRGSSPSSGKCASAWTMMLPVMLPVSAWLSF